MSRLGDLSKDKVTVMERIVSNQNLCKAIYYSNSGFLDQPDIHDTSILVYENVYPFSKIPEISNDTKTYITMSFGRYRQIDGGYFKSGIIYINVLVHKNNMQTDYGYLRTDYIVSAIDSLVQGDRGIGIGKVEFYEMNEFVANKDYLGVTIGYKLVEFN